MGPVKRLAFLVAALCSLSITCTPSEDTRPASLWVRTVRPRLSNDAPWRPCRRPPRAGRAIVESVCGEDLRFGEPPPIARTCDRTPRNVREAVKILTERPSCTDAATGALEWFARTRPEVWSDVAAAYYLRAERGDQPVDLLRALEAAELAVAATPRSASALFNYALIQQSLGFREDAVRAWDAFLAVDHTGWATEGAEQRAILLSGIVPGKTREWERDQPRLVRAAETADAATVRKLITMYPTAVPKYVELELFGVAKGEATPARTRAVLLIADEIARLTGDRQLLDTAQIIQRARQIPDANAALQRATESAAAAQVAIRALETARAEPLLRSVIADSSLVGLPLRLAAQQRWAQVAAYNPDPVRVVGPVLAQLESEALRRAYVRLLQRTHNTRAFAYFFGDRHVDALDEYDRALKYAERTKDLETIAAIHRAKAGVYRVIGSLDLAWRESIHALRHEPAITDVQTRHTLLGEVGSVAAELGYPRVALRYQNWPLRLWKQLSRACHPMTLPASTHSV